MAAALPDGAKGEGKAEEGASARKRRPNLVIYHSDQFRWDFVGANGRNGSTRTPNIDALAARGKTSLMP